MLFPSFFPMNHRKKHRKSCSFSHFPPAISERSVCPSEVLGLPVGGGWRYVSPGMFGPLLHTHIIIYIQCICIHSHMFGVHVLCMYIYTHIFIYLSIYVFQYLYYSHNAQVKKSCDAWLTFPWPASGPPVEGCFNMFYCYGFTMIYLNWLVVSTPLKNISHLGWLFPIWKNKMYVPNHQPVNYLQFLCFPMFSCDVDLP